MPVLCLVPERESNLIFNAIQYHFIHLTRGNSVRVELKSMGCVHSYEHKTEVT